MTQEQLKERIQKTEEKIAKIEKRIQKWEDAKSEKGFLKANSWLLDAGRDRDYLWNEHIKDCNDEIRRATRDLEDEKLKLVKYQNLLKLETSKDNEFENNRILVIWEFLLEYKNKVAEYIRRNISVLNRYYKVNSESCDWHNQRYTILKEKGISEEEWKEHYRELCREQRELKESIHPYTWLVAKRDYPSTKRIVDEEKLEEILIKDCKERYFQLVNEVTAITGIIIDATNLNMYGGELNGIIIGENGKAKVQTFSAGGWNIQCFHYRHKVSKVD